MKILHILYKFSDYSAVYRLASLQKEEGHSAYLYTKKGLYSIKSDLYIRKNNIFKLFHYYLANRLDFLFSYLLVWKEKKDTFCSTSLLPVPLPNYLFNQDWDAVHIHWISRNFCSLESVLKVNVNRFIHIHDFTLLLGGVSHFELLNNLNLLGKKIAKYISKRNISIINRFKVVLIAPAKLTEDNVSLYTSNYKRIITVPNIIPSIFFPKQISKKYFLLD